MGWRYCVIGSALYCIENLVEFVLFKEDLTAGLRRIVVIVILTVWEWTILLYDVHWFIGASCGINVGLDPTLPRVSRSKENESHQL